MYYIYGYALNTAYLNNISYSVTTANINNS